MYFAFNNILPLVWICLGTAVGAMIYLLTVYRRFTRLRPPAEEDAVPDADLPGVSVIIYARDNASELRENLPEILAQEYPEGKMEVIVVNDGSVDDVTDVVNHLGQQHPNLYITFVPDEAHNLSRKNLAVSLGIKAAKKETVVLTTAECRPASRFWLRRMAAPFRKSDVVLGWAAIDNLSGHSLRFDEAARGTTWISAALNRRPYRGTAFNLAYRRDLFFEAKGFSRSLNLHNGDDDIFIHQIANRGNTSVVLSPDALMTVSFQRPKAAYRDLRLRHCFTQRRLPKGARRLLGSGTLAMWVWVAAVATGVVFSLPNWFPSCLFAATVPALWIPLTVNWLRTGRTLGIKLSPALLWWEMLWRWLPGLRCRLACGSSDRRNFTWHTKKIK
ncbi:MAG: glycosyltransferase [Muribaculaceae bacterium]|nr:glycosyltransferase [Muribaculaceae bacterium]